MSKPAYVHLVFELIFMFFSLLVDHFVEIHEEAIITWSYFSWSQFA